jgi:ParB family chromosome partitioning protein
MIRTIPLNKLIPSPRNVRRRTDAQADLQLKADIHARGLLQNLVVTGVSRPKGSFAVEAGERRRRALQALADEGTLPMDFEVDCLVLEKGAAVQEASLAENFQRLSMNPADECLAFSALVEQGTDAEGIARRFGLTVRFVEGRLRLAGLAPVVFEALGAGEISLDVAKAYAATPDCERQEYVFDQMSRGYNAAHPDSVRRMMTQATVGAADRRALFVGEEAYVAAGDRVERDLFSDDAGARWLDVAILERLASEKLEAAAAATAGETGLGFVRPTLDSWIGHGQTEGLRRVAIAPTPLSEAENEEVEQLDGEIDELVEKLEREEMDEEERAAAEAKVRELGARLEELADKPPAVDEALKPRLGAFLVLDEAGRPRLDSTYYEAIPPAGEGGEGDDGREDEAGLTATTPPRAAGLSQRLVDELAMQRRDILAVHVAADPGFALDLAIFLMIDREAGYSGERTGSSLIAASPSNPVIDFGTPDAAATIARAEASDALDRSWTGGETRAERFDAFRALGEESRAAWLGHAVARTLEASLHLPGERNCAFHDHLGQLLAIDVAQWWRPTGANYFDRVPKSLTLAALGEVGGEALASRYGKAKKAELAEVCERIFAGDFIAEVEVKEAALAWLPGPMLFVREDRKKAETDGAGAPSNDGPAPETARSGSEATRGIEEAA